jgi:hypothetical protein
MLARPSRLDRRAIEHLRMRRWMFSKSEGLIGASAEATHLLILRCEGAARASKDALTSIQRFVKPALAAMTVDLPRSPPREEA